MYIYIYIYIYVSICDYIWYSRHFPAIHFEFGNFSLKRKAMFGHRSSGLLVQASGLVSSSFSLRMVMVTTHLTSKWPKPRWNIRTQAMDPLLVSWFTVTVKRIFDQVLWLGLLGRITDLRMDFPVDDCLKHLKPNSIVKSPGTSQET